MSRPVAASVEHPTDCGPEGRRALLVCAAMMVVFSLLSARLIELQHGRHEELRERAEAAQRTRVELPARRGELRDRNGVLLACDQSVHDLYVDKVHLRHPEVAARSLAQREGMTVRDVRRLFNEEQIVEQHLRHVAAVLAQGLQEDEEPWREQLLAPRPLEITVARALEDRAAQLWREWLEQNHVEGGVYFRDAVKRFYAHADRITQVLGFVDHRHIGREGVEATMNEWLTGRAGFRDIERDGRGRELPVYRRAQRAPQHGHHVHLTIDMQLQEILEQVLEQAMLEYLPEKVMAVVVEPSSGDVLALGARPAWIRGASAGMRRNLAITDVYEPGSTFKLVTLAAAFEEGICGPGSSYFCHHGHYSDPALPVPLRDAGSYGDLTAVEIFAKSSNIGTYQMARRLGSERLHRHAQQFGFGRATGIALTAEGTGRLRSPDQWSGTSLSRVMMGYEVSVTTLQMALATAVVANEGLLMQPRLVDRIVDADGAAVEVFDPEPVRRVLRPEVARQVRDAMVAVTREGGTGTRAALEGIDVAGKTGTARKFDPASRQYAEGRYVASFIGFAPAEAPQLAAVVVVDDPRSDPEQRFGGQVAAPVFAELMERSLGHLRSAGVGANWTVHDFDDE